MMKMMGLDPSTHFQHLVFDQSSVKGKFYLIIDGFDEFMFSKYQFEAVLKLLLDVLSIYKLSNWFKVVILMRDSTWLNWSRALMIHPTFWFIDGMNDQGQNVGLLTANELDSFIGMKRAFTDNEFTAEEFEILRYPLFHQIYYKRYLTIISYDKFNELLIYELIIDYMVQNIVYGNQSLNKMDLIFYLLNLMEWFSGWYSINRSKIQLQQVGFLKAYLILLQLGFLREIESISALNKKVYVYFSFLHYLGCCVAAFVLKDDPEFTPLKLEYILQRWNKNTELKRYILKWCIYQSVSVGKKEDWINGYNRYLNADDLRALSSFMLLMKTQEIRLNKI
jgi:hypothetical protein